MVYSISIHRPKPEHVQEVIDSMHRYGEAARAQPGLVQVHTLRARDEDPPVLIGLAVWETAEAKAAAGDALAAAVAGDRFDEWDTRPIEGFLAEEV